MGQLAAMEPTIIKTNNIPLPYWMTRALLMSLFKFKASPGVSEWRSESGCFLRSVTPLGGGEGGPGGWNFFWVLFVFWKFLVP